MMKKPKQPTVKPRFVHEQDRVPFVCCCFCAGATMPFCRFRNLQTSPGDREKEKEKECREGCNGDG
jgi:hypothetical protein